MNAWSPSEFELLRLNHMLTDEELAERLPGRSLGAIGVVRSGLHSYHRGQDISMLSRIMQDSLAAHRGLTICPKCHRTI